MSPLPAPFACPVALPWALWSDRRVRLVRVHYVFDPLGEKVQEGLERLFGAFERAHLGAGVPKHQAVPPTHRRGDPDRLFLDPGGALRNARSDQDGAVVNHSQESVRRWLDRVERAAEGIEGWPEECRNGA